MSKVLKHNVMLQRDPPIGKVHSFLKGDALPDWAEDLVGEHLFENARGGVAAPKEVERKLPSHEVPSPEPEPELEVPTRKAGAPTWRKFAKAASVDIPPRATREEIIEKVLIAYPDLEVLDS